VQFKERNRHLEILIKVIQSNLQSAIQISLKTLWERDILNSKLALDAELNLVEMISSTLF